MEWTDMVHYQQQMQKIMRSLLPEHKSGLTVSECELLAQADCQVKCNSLWEKTSRGDFQPRHLRGR